MSAVAARDVSGPVPSACRREMSQLLRTSPETNAKRSPSGDQAGLRSPRFGAQRVPTPTFDVVHPYTVSIGVGHGAGRPGTAQGC